MVYKLCYMYLLNSQLFFRISDFTLSGCGIDPKSITLFPSGKYRPFLGRYIAGLIPRPSLWSQDDSYTAAVLSMRCPVQVLIIMCNHRVMFYTILLQPSADFYC